MRLITWRNFYFLIASLVTIFTVASCYTSINSPSNQVIGRIEMRNEVVRKYVRSDLKIGQRYVDYGFANERVIKPSSFRRLDSLYFAYQEEEKKSGASKNKLISLKNEIEREKSKVIQDTVHFLYEKPHFFAQDKGDTTSITFADFTLNSKNEIILAKIHYSFDTPRRNSQFFQIYLLKESFVEFGYSASTEEMEFYNFYDNMIANLNDAETKSTFIEHTLQIMRAANQQGKLNTENLIKQHVINTITNNVKNYKPLKWSQIFTNLNENDVLLSYELDHEWSYIDKQGQTYQLKRTFVLSPYLEIVSTSEPETLRN